GRLLPHGGRQLPVLGDAGRRPAAVADQQERGVLAQRFSLARRTRALHAAAATALPPLTPAFLTAGRPLVRNASFDSAAPTNPTGSPTTYAGRTSPATARRISSSRAVGAHPTTQTAPSG